MLIKTSELEGQALEWATKLAIGNFVGTPWGRMEFFFQKGGTPLEVPAAWEEVVPPISEISFRVSRLGVHTTFYANDVPAACRAIVAAKLGDEVEVPDELLCAPL